MDYGKRRISQDTIDKFFRLHDLIEAHPGEYNVSLSASRLGLAVSTVSRFVTQKPWADSFRRDDYGMLRNTGYNPHTRRTEDAEEDSPVRPIASPTPKVGKYDFTAYLETYQFIINEHVRVHTNPGEFVDRSQLMSGKEQEDFLNQLYEKVHELHSKLEEMAELPNFGKDEWWIDYYDPTS